MSELYRPSNGTEGDCFTSRWCHHCAREAAYRDGGPDADPALGCPILADAYAFGVDEWITDERGPRCTAYTEDPTCPVRCDRTPDLFVSGAK